MKKHQAGFTLLEISIVVVIIGIITGGVIIARDLIRNSQMRAAVDEYQSYVQSLNSFNDKYGQLPGDFSTATSIWGAANGVHATCITITNSPTATCNGGGDGWITDQATSTTHYEQFTAWHQLYLAGMNAYTTTPVAGSGGTQHRTIGYNIPPSKLSGAGWGLIGLKASYIASDSVLTAVVNDVPAKHVLILGGNTYTTGYTAPFQMPVLSTQEAKEMDDKIDDGYATTGRLVAMTNPGGATSCYINSLDYDLTLSGLYCTMVFKTGL